MSHSTNSNVTSVNFCDVCNLSFETMKGLYRHQSCDPKHKELLEKMFDLRSSFNYCDLVEAITEASTKTESSTKTIEKIYDSDGDFIYVKPLLKLKLKILLKLKLNPTTTSTTELSLNVKNVTKNLEVK